MGRTAHDSRKPSALASLIRCGLGAGPAFAEWSVVIGATVTYTANLFQFSSGSCLSAEQDYSRAGCPVQALQCDLIQTTSYGWRAELQRKVTDRWMINFIGRCGLRFCGEPFEECDTRFWSAGSQVGVTQTSWSTITVAYLYERGLAVGVMIRKGTWARRGLPPLVLGV